MLDLELVFCEKSSVASAITSEAKDLHQDKPNTGSYGMYIVVTPTTAGSGTGTVTFNVQDSANNSSFATVLSTGAIAGNDLTKPVVIPMPVQHKRYVRVTSAVSGTLSGNVTVYMSDKFGLPADYKIEGYDIVPTVD